MNVRTAPNVLGQKQTVRWEVNRADVEAGRSEVQEA